MIYERCPNCEHKPSGLLPKHMDIFECNDCDGYSCWDCENEDGVCPHCGGDNRKVVGIAQS